MKTLIHCYFSYTQSMVLVGAPCFMLLLSCNVFSQQLESNSSSRFNQLADTSKITIFTIDSTNFQFFENSIPAKITREDVSTIDTLLKIAIKYYNHGLGNDFQGYIDLQKYKRQYVVFRDKNGCKKVYVNCFRGEQESEFNYWKNALVEVDDGGSNFFHVTINLTTGISEDVYVNGIG